MFGQDRGRIKVERRDELLQEAVPRGSMKENIFFSITEGRMDKPSYRWTSPLIYLSSFSNARFVGIRERRFYLISQQNTFAEDDFSPFAKIVFRGLTISPHWSTRDFRP